ncbi:hypothetical protein QR680_002187 [Steinernema hermaphroditum]|uniref:Myosin tail domain-containing protein n=1 Tax=Steinernema hermaphroditum TaxID=289476 RepID=A0AA39H1P2_9BILA|nr:hypothetical protein QR680_002187 [Steinernema hermaphroditum]
MRKKTAKTTIEEPEDALQTAGDGRGKAGAISQRKKLKAQNSKMEQQLELANRLKEEYYKQLKKTQMIVKECQQDADEARQAKENVVTVLKKSE